MVASFVGYTVRSPRPTQRSEVRELQAGAADRESGLEKQYESILHGKEGVRFDESMPRAACRGEGPRPDLTPVGAPPLYTNIDMDLQKFTVGIFGDSLQGGAVAIDPSTGEVLALYSAPSWDPNKFTGGIPVDYYKQLLEDKRRPLVNKAIQGTYPPGSTWKLATSILCCRRVSSR